MKLGFLLALVPLALLAPRATAGVVTGRVVDSNGAGVANVDLDFDNTGSGGDPTVSGDFTDPNGFFTTTVTPDGIYTISFKPPAPPTTTHLVVGMDDVAVVGTINLGTITLPPGVSLSGRTISGIDGQPLAGVNLDVVELATGADLVLVGDTSNALGLFEIAVPTGALDVRFKPSGTALAPANALLTIGGATNMNDVTLEEGFTLSASLLTTAGGLPVENADVDVVDAATGAKLFTPGDNSDSGGFMDVIVPAGTYDLEFCPELADQLVAEERLGLVVSAATFLGTIHFDAGVLLSGKVKNTSATPLESVDVDVRKSATQQAIVLCNDNTNTSGDYVVVIPTGTFHVTFTPATGQPYSSLTVTNVVVNGNKTLNATLPGCGSVTSYCTPGTTSSGCMTTLSASGVPSATAASGFDLIASNGEGSKTGIYFYGTSGQQAASWGNGTSFQCVVPPVRRGEIVASTGTNGICNGTFTYDLNARWTQKPNHNPGPGALVQAQLWFRDPDNTSNQSTSLSDAVEFTVCP